jgi:hypothetical protein
MKLSQTGGKIRDEITKAPQSVYTCQCVDCQCLTSSAFSMAIVLTDVAFRIAGIEPRAIQRTADSGAVVTRWVCPECGSWVCGASSSDDGLRRLRAGMLDDTSWLRPTAQFLDPQQAALDYAARGRSDFRDAACHIIRADETPFSRPILALEERDGELC